MKDNTSVKKSTARPADPKIIELPNAINRVIPLPTETTGEAAEEVKNLRLQAFPDGFIFKFTEHPKEEGKFVLYDMGQRPIAVTQSAPIADLLCQAVRMLFQAVEESKRPKPGTPDNLVAECNTPEMRAGQSPVMES